MKHLLFSFLICAAIYRGADSASEAELTTIAENLLVKVKATILNANRAILEGLIALQKADQVKSQIDADVSKDPKIVQLEENIKSHASSAEVEKCRVLKDQKVQNLVDTLSQMLRTKVTMQMSEDKATLVEVDQRLSKIEYNLEDNAKEEIDFCINNPVQCRLTGDYANEVMTCDEFIQRKNQLALTIVKDTLTDLVEPLIPADVTVEIFKPVNDCVNNL